MSFRRAVATDAKMHEKVKNGALNRKILVWVKSESRRRRWNVVCVSSRRGSALCKGVSCSVSDCSLLWFWEVESRREYSSDALNRLIRGMITRYRVARV